MILESVKGETTEATVEQTAPFQRLTDWIADKHRVEDFLEFSFGVYTPWRLLGAVSVWKHSREILLTAPKATRAKVHESLYDRWPPMLRTLTSDPISLANELFPSRTTNMRRERGLFLQGLPPNPLNRRGMTEYSLFACLWTSHPTRPIPFRTLQRHVTFAHLSILQAHSSVEQWLAGTPLQEHISSGLYLPGLQIRNFSQPCGRMETVLRDEALDRIPLDCPAEDFPSEVTQIGASIAQLEHKYKKELSAEYAEAARRRGSKGRAGHSPESINFQKVSQGLRSIASLVSWGFDPLDVPAQERDGGPGGNPNGGGPPVGGWNEDDNGSPDSDADDFDLDDADAGDPGTADTLTFGDDTDPKSGRIRVGVRVRSKLSHQERAARVSAGDHPADSGTESTQYLVDDEEGVRLIFGGAPEMARQCLSYQYEDLSPIEVATGLNQLREKAESGDLECRELYALCSTSLWSSSKLNSAIDLLVSTGPLAESLHGLALYLGDESAFWRKTALEVKLHTELPPIHLVQPIEKHFDLPDAVGGSNPVRSFLDYLRSEIGLPAAQSAAISRKPLRLFSHDLGWYRERLDTLALANGRFTWARLARVLHQAIIDHTQDRVLASIITANDQSSSEVGRHYATPAIRELQQIYLLVTSSLRDELHLGGYDMKQLNYVPLAHPDLAVGSPLHPRIPLFKEMVRALKGMISPPGAKNWSIDRHNALTGYVVEMAAVGAAYRGIKSPYQYPEQIDFTSGLTFVVDKGISKGRLVVWTEIMSAQSRLYENYLDRLSTFLGRRRPKLPCYFLRDDGTEEEVSPTSILRHLREWLPVANAARHLTYTHLLELGLPEFRDCLCGHGARGEEPFRCSTFQYAKYQRELAIVIDDLLRELEFEPLDICDLC